MMISVIVATRDRASLLEGTLEALSKQTSPGCPVEIVVVDNGSVDRTREVAEAAMVGSSSRMLCSASCRSCSSAI